MITRINRTVLSLVSALAFGLVIGIHLFALALLSVAFVVTLCAVAIQVAAERTYRWLELET